MAPEVMAEDPDEEFVADPEWGRQMAHQLQEKLFDLRRVRRMPIVRMSEAMGVTDSIVHRLERNERDARLSTILRYAKCLGLDLALVEKDKAIA